MSEDETDPRNMPLIVKIVGTSAFMAGVLPILCYGAYLAIKGYINSLPDDAASYYVDDGKLQRLERIESAVDDLDATA